MKRAILEIPGNKIISETLELQDFYRVRQKNLLRRYGSLFSLPAQSNPDEGPLAAPSPSGMLTNTIQRFRSTRSEEMWNDTLAMLQTIQRGRLGPTAKRGRVSAAHSST